MQKSCSRAPKSALQIAVAKNDCEMLQLQVGRRPSFHLPQYLAYQMAEKQHKQ